MKRLLIIFFILVVLLVALAISAGSWLPPLLGFVTTNSETIQGLQALVQLVLWAGVAGVTVATFFFGQQTLPKKKLEKLRSQIPSTKILDYYNPRVQGWRRKFRNTLFDAFGEDSYFVNEYDKIAWRTSDKPEDATEQYNLYTRSWSAAEGLLEAAIDHLQRSAKKH